MTKKFFVILIVLVSGVGLWMGGRFFFSLYHYFLLSQATPALVNRWKVEEIQSGNFIICATFAFQVGEQTLYQSFRFPKPVYQNQDLAYALVEKWKERDWQVWYNPKNLKMVSLQRSFPIKAGVYFILSVGVVLYFLGLKIYIQRVGAVDVQ